MQKVVINGDYLAFNTFAGVSRFATEILAELDLMVEDLNVELLTPEYVDKSPEFKSIKIVKYGQDPILKWKNTSLPQYVNKQKALLVDLTQAFPFGVKGITCVHDCIPELVSTAYSGLFGKMIKKPLKLMQRRAVIRNSIAIITVSECSKKDIARLYHVAQEKITVVGNAWQHIEKTPYDDAIINTYNLEAKKFYFSLGSRVEHKNLKWIVAAALQNPNSLFVVSGENSYSKGFDESQFPKNIIFTGYISDGEIRSLMANCKAFILPSIYEGFGIPPMEALAENAQIIVSNTSCLPEIYRNSAHYIDPYQLENINLDNILLEHVEGPEEVLDKYSWNKSAKTLYSLILKVVYTGPIDAYFDYKLGTLEYRSVRFENELLDKPSFQGNAAVNYTDRETPWTRIIEHKWFEFGKDENGNDLSKTIISREYSSEWKPGDEPYYPVNDEKNIALYDEYKKMAEAENQVIFGGRLGEYKYYDMDQVIEAALNMCQKCLN